MASGERLFVTTVSASASVSAAPQSSNTNQNANQATFASLHLAPAILDALIADGYQNPTPIQAQAIPPALNGSDVLGIAQTGTGKTAAFALPILNRLLSNITKGLKLPVGRRPKVLVLSPTRELAAQIAESFSSYGRHTPLRHAVIFGGVGQGPQVRAIQQGVDIIVATPGRLIDLLDQRLVNLSEIEFFVLDEADRMLDMGFIEPIRRISGLLPKARQTMLFSATMPKEIRHLADSLLRNPVTVTVTPVSSAVDRIDQTLYFVLKAQKTQLLIHLFDTLDMGRTVVFTKTKHGADRLTRKLKAAGIHAEAIHGDKAQNQRVRALEAFRSGRSSVLVATDVAARGLDIDDITHVVNYDQPMEPEAYVHRIGRTARAGKSGHAIAFCDVEEKGLLKQVERLIKFEIPRVRVPDCVPKTDESAAKAGGVMVSKPMQNGGRESSPMIETQPVRPAAHHSQQRTQQPKSQPSRPQQPRRDDRGPAPRAHGPRIDRPIDQGPATEDRGIYAPRASMGKPGARSAAPSKSAPPIARAGEPAPKPAQKSWAPKPTGPGRFGNNPFGKSGKPNRGTNFRGGTGFKGPKP